jgi:hypothetical protein
LPFFFFSPFAFNVFRGVILFCSLAFSFAFSFGGHHPDGP